jgi:hypothetical protein
MTYSQFCYNQSFHTANWMSRDECTTRVSIRVSIAELIFDEADANWIQCDCVNKQNYIARAGISGHAADWA